MNKIRLKFADRIMTFCLDKRLNNISLVKVIFFVYQQLVRNVYVSEYTQDARHHYIPQFLLRKFQIEKTNSICQYTFFEQPKSVSISKDAAFVRDLYTSTEKETKVSSDFIEKQLFAYTLEKYAARIINKIIKDDEIVLTFLEESIVTSFVSFQYIRTPKFLNHIKNILEYLSLAQKIPLDETIKEDFYYKTFFENAYNITPEVMGKFCLNNKLELTGAENLILKIAIQIGDRLSETIYKRNLRILEVVEPGFFYLSDSPVDIYNLARMRSVGPFLWELKDEVLIYLPISPYRCLYYTRQGYDIKPEIIGNIISIAIPDSIFQFAYSDRKTDLIKAKYDVAKI